MPAKKRSSRPRRFRELKPAELRWVCRPSAHNLSPEEKDQSLIGIIGQERAIRALKLGIELYGPGYNVFVCGITGTGRASTVQKILDRIKGFCPVPLDRAYVQNFRRPDEPALLTLPRGFAEKLRTDMERFVKEIQTEVPGLLDSEQHGKKRERIVAKYEGEGDRIIEKFERRAEKEGFALKRVREGNISRPELFPIIQGQALPILDLDKAVTEGKLGQKKAGLIVRQYQALRQNLEATARQSRDLLSRMDSEIIDLERKEVRSALQERIDRMVAGYPGEGASVVTGYLAGVLEEIISNLDLFRRTSLSTPATGGGASASTEGPAMGADGTGPNRLGLQALLDRLKVNVILDGRSHQECPVVIETHPSYRRLFGYFEKQLDQSGHWTTDYSRIRPGSLLAADGGYLVVTAEDLFSQNDVWTELKRTLISRSLAILEEGGGLYVPTITMKPEPIPINVKVIMIGQRWTYEALLASEHDFSKMFKVFADFDEEMDLNAKTLRQYAAFVRKVCADEKLAELDAQAIAAVAEFGARVAGRQGKLSTRFGEIADLLREADYWRRQDGSPRRVTAKHIRKALKESEHRRNLTEEKLQEMLRQGQIFIEVKGQRIGQVNGLTIQETGTHRFGLPARITATASPGTAGIINIERESRLSGDMHTKGVLIIGGFFRERFGRHQPVTLTASIAFEQLFGGVDGDSASSTEVYALLSALSGVPIHQGIGVTGSVDQKGFIQPVGGINDKVEGFYRACSLKGLTGDQGVLVPDANMADLMLDDEVVDAVRRKKFHVWPVRTIEDGIEILTGVPAGTADDTGKYDEGTLFGLAARRLTQFNETVRDYFKGSSL